MGILRIIQSYANETVRSFCFRPTGSPPPAHQNEKGFKPGEPPKLSSDFRIGRIDWHNPQIPRFVHFVALRGIPASFGPTGAGNRRAGENGGAVESCHRVPVGALPGRTLPRKPENQARYPDRSPTERPSPGGPAFSRRRSAAASPGRRSD
jgi:hypothetical protein